MAKEDKVQNKWTKFLLDNLQKDLERAGVKPIVRKKGLPAPNCKDKYEFGDVRFEMPKKTIAIEIEGGGGIDNFLKYWPYLSGQTDPRPEKDFVLIHIYCDPTYQSHKALWWFFRGRMPTFIVDAEFCIFEKAEVQKDAILEKIRQYLNDF